MLLAHKTPVTPGCIFTVFPWSPNKLQNAEVCAVQSQPSPQQRGGNAVALPLDTVGSHRTPSDSAHFEYAQNKCRRSVVAQCSNKSAVGSPSCCQSRAVSLLKRNRSSAGMHNAHKGHSANALVVRDFAWRLFGVNATVCMLIG